MLLKRQGSIEDIIGFGTVYCRMPAFTSAIWDRYGPATGAPDKGTFEEQVARRHTKRSVADPVIGNIIVENPVLFPDRPFKLFQQSEVQPGHHSGIPLPAATCEHLILLLFAHAKNVQLDDARIQPPTVEMERENSLRLHAWEDAVRTAYYGGCAITSVKVRDVLRVVSIMPFELGGPHHVSNGILLDLNLAMLQVNELITFHANGALLVSPDLALQDRELYRAIAGKPLKPPKRPEDQPDLDLVRWRLDNRFKR